MSLGNANIHQRGEIPEIIKLPNGRIRVIRRFQKFTREDVDNANLGSLMGDFGSLDTDGEQIVNQGYTNCCLISVEIDTRFNNQANADNAVLVKTYETLTDTFVEISSDTEEVGESNLKKITKVYRAKSGTPSSGVVGTTPLNPDEDGNSTDGILLASSKIEDNTGLAELTEEYIESGVLSISKSHRYGDKINVYSVEGINITASQGRTAINELPADAKLYGTKVSNFLGFETNTFEFFTGSGEISRTISQSYNDKLTRTTIVSVDDKPTLEGAVLVESKAETRDEFILYTYVFVAGTGVVSTETSEKYGSSQFTGKLSVVTVTSITAEVEVPSGSFVKESSVREESGYLLYTTTYVSGSGQISESNSLRYLGKLEIDSQTWLNTPSPVVPVGFTLIGTESKEGDYGLLTTITYAKGEGIISSNDEERNDGSRVQTTVVLGDTKPPTPSGHHLMETSYQAQDGYDVYTYYYYKTPDDYNVDISTQWNKPSLLKWSREEGFFIGTVGSLESITGKSAVTFTRTPPSAIPLADLSVGAVARESVKYVDGTRLVRSTAFTNTFHDGAGSTVQNGEYIGTEVSNGVVSSSGQNLPSGTVTIGWETVPYFYAGGETIYKTTHTTANI